MIKKLLVLLLGTGAIYAQTLAPTISYSTQSTTGAITFNLAAAPAVGELMLAYVNYSNTNAPRTISAPDSNWALLDTASQGNMVMTVWSRLAIAGDGTSYVFTISGASDYYASGILVHVKNNSLAAPVNQHSIFVNPNAGTFNTGPTGLVPSVPGTLPIMVRADAGGNQGGNTMTGNSPYSLLVSARSFWQELYSWSGPLTTDTTTAITGSGSTNTSTSGITSLILVAPGINVTACSSVQEGQVCTLTYNKPVSITVNGSGTSDCSTGCTVAHVTAATNTAGYEIDHMGCPVFPADSIYSTRIDAMPVNTKNTTWNTNQWAVEPISYLKWDGSSSGWGTTPINNSTPLTSFTFNYGGPTLGVFAPTPDPKPFPLVEPQLVYRENGGFSGAPGNGGTKGDLMYTDNHEEYVNTDNCDIWQTYNGMPGTSARTAGTYQSIYGSNPYNIYISGNTGAVTGMDYSATILTRNDVKYGLHHPLDIAITQFVNNAGPSCPTCAVGGYGWPAFYNGYGGANPPQSTLPGSGSWGRLSNAWCNANLNTYTGNRFNLLAGLCHYGFIVSDWASSAGYGGHIDTDTRLDPGVMADMYWLTGALASITSGGNNVEWIDVSSLSTCSPWWNCGSARVNPNNGLVTPPAYMSVTASDGGVDNSLTTPITLIPVTVGTLHPALIIEAGILPSYQLTWYVHGTTNSTVTWTGTNVSSTGLFTIPATATTITQYDLTGASAVDSNALVHVSVFVIPNNADQSIKMDLGGTCAVYSETSSSCAYSSDSNNWVSDKFLPQEDENPTYNTTYTNNNWPGTTPDLHVYTTPVYQYAGEGDLVYGEFVMPAGTYQATWMSNPVNGTNSVQRADGINNFSGSDFGPVYLSANKDVTGFFNFGLVNPANPNLNNVDQRITTPAVVGSDNILSIRMHATVEYNTNGICCRGWRHTAIAQGVYIQKYTGAAKWVLLTSQKTTVNVGQTVQCYLQDWGTGSGAHIVFNNSYLIATSSDRSNGATWSVLPGGVGGTINAISGLYTAPASLAVSGYDTIKLTDTALGLSQTVQIWVNGLAQPALLVH